ncbi:MAG: tetratricopeptide repeat protein [Bacteroidales bacterium]|nr:tetratricopeptide repeat protein [Candidatus Sodaliphilus aphodohippi]
MTRYLNILILLLVTAVPVLAGNTNQATQAYDNEAYNKALEIYLEQEKTATSSRLCYNIGNTYYRLKDNAHAILYYERALLLDPSNSDARFNLEFTREKAAISENSGETFFSQYIDSMVSHVSSNAWTVVAVLSFLLFLAAVVAYFVAENVTVRKFGFFGGATLLVCCVVANVCAFRMYHKAVGRSAAIVMAEKATLSSSPRQPKDKSEIAFELNQGTKVEITDSVKVQGVMWLNVETADLQHAWINNKDIEII